MPVIDEGLMEGGLKEKEGLPEVTEEAWTLREDMAEARASMEVVSALTSALASAWKRPMTFNPPMFNSMIRWCPRAFSSPCGNLRAALRYS